MGKLGIVLVDEPVLLFEKHRPQRVENHRRPLRGLLLQPSFSTEKQWSDVLKVASDLFVLGFVLKMGTLKYTNRHLLRIWSLNYLNTTCSTLYFEPLHYRTVVIRLVHYFQSQCKRYTSK